MKLDRFLRVGLVAVTVVLGCACSSAVPAARAAAPSQSSASGTTSLMSAQIAGPAPKVGKAHLVADDASTLQAGTNGTSEHALPKEGRRSDGSRRGGGFGTTK